MSHAPGTSGRDRVTWRLTCILAAIAIVGHFVRDRLGIELTTSSLQSAVAELGWWGPLLFFLLVTFRQLLAIPAALILATGGVCFGTTLGTALGGGGVILSGILKFVIARRFGREWVRRHLGATAARLEAQVSELGPVLIGVSTAHPFGVLALFHWGAGLSSIRFAPFAIAVILGAPVRAFALAAFGATLADPSTTEFRVAVAALVLVAVLPLTSPAVRARLRDLRESFSA